MPDFTVLIILAVIIFIVTRVGKAMKGGFQAVLEQLEHSGDAHRQGSGFRRPGQPIGRPAQQMSRAAPAMARPVSVPTRPPGVGPPPMPTRRQPSHTPRPGSQLGAPPLGSGNLVKPAKVLAPPDDPWAMDEDAVGPSLAAAGTARRMEDRDARRAKKESGAIRFVRALQGANAETLRGAIVLADILGPPVAIRNTEDRLAEWK